MALHKYETPEAAEVIQERMVKDYETGWCAAFGTTCKGEKCHSFLEGAVCRDTHKDRKPDFYVHKPMCMLPQVTGVISCSADWV